MMQSQCKRSRLASKPVLALSRGRKKLCTIDLLAERIDAEGYLDWFVKTHESNGEAEMLAANPDHWLIRATDDAREEVIELVGGSPLPSHIFIRFKDKHQPALQPDPIFPERGSNALSPPFECADAASSGGFCSASGS